MTDYLDEDTLDDLFKIYIIDKINKKKVSVQLEDSESGDVVNLKDVLDQVDNYVSDQLKSKVPNSTTQQIFPLMAQNLVHGLPKHLGRYNSAIVLSTETLKYTYLFRMTASFYLLKFIQKNNLKIVTIEEDISEQEIEKFERLNRASSAISLAHLAGVDPKDLVKEMIKRGSLDKGDLEDMGMDLSEEDKKDDTSN